MPNSDKSQPALFISHGAPTLAIDNSPAHHYLKALGTRLRRPKAIIILSAHFDRTDIRVGINPTFPTLYDFGGFPDVLYTLHYPAVGDVDLAHAIIQTLRQQGIIAKPVLRGLDHGAWIPLSLLAPLADTPIIPISLNSQETSLWHYQLGQALAPLRHDNILIIGSGSLTHNLDAYFTGQFPQAAPPPAWVRAFSDWIYDQMAVQDYDSILEALTLAPYALRNHPTPEHLYPLFFALGAGSGLNGKQASLRLHNSTSHGILSMDMYGFGESAILRNLTDNHLRVLAQRG